MAIDFSFALQNKTNMLDVFSLSDFHTPAHHLPETLDSFGSVSAKQCPLPVLTYLHICRRKEGIFSLCTTQEVLLVLKYNNHLGFKQQNNEYLQICVRSYLMQPWPKTSQKMKTMNFARNCTACGSSMWQWTK